LNSNDETHIVETRSAATGDEFQHSYAAKLSHASKSVCDKVCSTSDNALLNSERQFDKADAIPETISSNSRQTPVDKAAVEESEAVYNRTASDFTEPQNAVSKRTALDLLNNNDETHILEIHSAATGDEYQHSYACS
jgi:hypothetical protein